MNFKPHIPKFIKRLTSKRKDKYDYYGVAKQIVLKVKNVRYPYYHREVWHWIKFSLWKPLSGYVDEKIEIGITQGVKQLVRTYGWALLVVILLFIGIKLSC